VSVKDKPFNREELQQLDDEQLLQLIRHGDDYALDHLIYKYKNFVRAKARTYFLIGADREDIIQEGMIGLYKAIRDYDQDKQRSEERRVGKECRCRWGA